jgi:hypothetical protein
MHSKTALEFFEQQPDLEAIPLEENGEPLGVVLREITGNFAISARGIPEGSAFVSRVVDENIRIDQGKFPAWFMIRHYQQYFGIISLQYMLKYIKPCIPIHRWR